MGDSERHVYASVLTGGTMGGVDLGPGAATNTTVCRDKIKKVGVDVGLRQKKEQSMGVLINGGAVEESVDYALNFFQPEGIQRKIKVMNLKLRKSREIIGKRLPN
eukprot:18461_1